VVEDARQPLDLLGRYGRLAFMTPRGLPTPGVTRVRRHCADRVPERVRHQVHVECDVADLLDEIERDPTGIFWG
jgi:hypothetical protein